jgi:hypothetical protein
VSKAGACPSEASIGCSRVALGLGHKDQLRLERVRSGASPRSSGPGRCTCVDRALNYKHETSLERSSRSKHSSLLQAYVNYGRKRFITLDQGAAGRFTNSSDLSGTRALETTGASVIKPLSLTAQINKLGQGTLSEGAGSVPLTSSLRKLVLFGIRITKRR